jgi:hypothetical protein
MFHLLQPVLTTVGGTSSSWEIALYGGVIGWKTDNTIHNLYMIVHTVRKDGKTILATDHRDSDEIKPIIIKDKLFKGKLALPRITGEIDLKEVNHEELIKYLTYLNRKWKKKLDGLLSTVH